MTTRDKAMQILGQLKAIQFPMASDDSNAFYDLVDSIAEQYAALLKQFYPDFEE
jgi:hypothetical protein